MTTTTTTIMFLNVSTRRLQTDLGQIQNNTVAVNVLNTFKLKICIVNPWH